MMRRLVRAYARRVEVADPDDLADLVAIRDQVDELLGDVVRRMREHQGWSWAEIAAPLGITRQAAQQRFGARRPRGYVPGNLGPVVGGDR